MTCFKFFRIEDQKATNISLPSIKSVSEDGDDYRRSFGSFSSLKRYTSKTSLISTYDFIRDKVSDAVPKSFKKKPDETKLRFVVAFFFLVIVLVISLAQIFYAQHKGQVSYITIFLICFTVFFVFRKEYLEMLSLKNITIQSVFMMA